MADMPRDTKERALRPPIYEGREPECAYAYDFTDYLGIISVEVGAVGPFVDAVTSGESNEARLPIRIEAIGVFSGRTEIDIEERDDIFEEPQPHGPYLFGESLPPHAKLPFAEKPGVEHPDNELLEAFYRVDTAMGGSEIGLTTRQDRAPHHTLRLEGGVIEVKGAIDIPSSAELTTAVAAGYTSPGVKIILDAPLAVQESQGLTSAAHMFTSPASLPLLIERVYNLEPRWLERPYNHSRAS